MPRTGLSTSLLAVFLVAPMPLQAAMCTQDGVPAATLLIPYFEQGVACDDSPTRGTRFTVTNVDRAPVLTRVSLWTNTGLVTYTFDIYLNGYDQQTVDLERVLCDGWLPSTGSGVAPGPGRHSQAAVAFPNCNATSTPGQPPVYGGDGAIPTQVRDTLTAALRGNPLPANATLCAALPNGRGTADGFITIDTVNRCSAAAIGLPGFGDHLAGNNVLIGSAVLLDDADNTSVGLPVVPLEATASAVLDFSSSFYGLAGQSVGPRREPLPPAWMTEAGSAGQQGAAELIVWRSPPTAGAAFTCASGPTWYPLQPDNRSGFGSRGVFHVRDDGSALASEREAPLPLMAQRVDARSEFPELINLASGWTYLSLSRSNAGAAFPAQAWVGTLRREPGRYAFFYEGVPVGDACDDTPFDNTSPGPLTVPAGF